MESKLMLLCGLMLIFCVTAISAELVAYPHVGCFTGTNVWRYFNRQLKLTPSRVTQKEDDILRCFEAARDENFDIFALTKTKRNGNLCLSGKDAKKNLNRYQEGSDCKNGLGGQNNNFDIYLVPGGESESCEDLPDGEYQDSLFCNRFYTCMDGKATVKLCPSGLLFDPVTRQCLTEVTCPRGEPCKYYQDGEYPHPTSCRKYLVCNNREAYEAECPSHLWFNDDTKECDSPSNTYCSNDPCEDSSCLNGGTCMASQEEVSHFKCICKAGFSGARCEAKVGFVSSEILSDNEDLFKILLKYLKDVETNGKEWKMCYNAKEHSYSAASFHDHCNNKGPTVTLARVGQFVFGGYTDQAWTSSQNGKSSSKSFLFSLRGPSKTPFKSLVFQGRGDAILDYSNYGPTFGGGADLYLSDSCRTQVGSYSNLGKSYPAPSGYTANQALAGSNYFLCDEYEVFYLA